jgi:hypothetical protein
LSKDDTSFPDMGRPVKVGHGIIVGNASDCIRIKPPLQVAGNLGWPDEPSHLIVGPLSKTAQAYYYGPPRKPNLAKLIYLMLQLAPMMETR